MSRVGIIFVGVSVLLVSQVVQGQYGGGSGDPNNPYLIYDPNQMNSIGLHPEDWDKNFRLMNNISFSGYMPGEFNPIGISTSEPFSGVFDGNGHRISNIEYTSSGHAGIFSNVIGEKAKIMDLNLLDIKMSGNGGSLVEYLRYATLLRCSSVNPNVSSGNTCGGLVGSATEANIINCHCSNGVVSSYELGGGLIGYLNQGNVEKCSAYGTVYGETYVGGLVGINGHYTGKGGCISECYSHGTIEGGTQYSPNVGGLVGGMYGGTIVNSYSYADIFTHDYGGGLIGTINTRGTVINCYSYGRILLSGRGFIGRIYSGGHIEHIDVLNCFWDKTASGAPSYMDDPAVWKTTEEMKDAATFAIWGAGNSAWVINSGVDYPRLAWQNTPGSMITDPFYFEGEGILEHPYEINSAELLDILGRIPFFWNKSFVLKADINLSAFNENDFHLIGINANWPFCGNFDGNGYTISSFKYNLIQGESRDYLGLFSYVQNGATIKNLNLLYAKVTNGASQTYVGALVGILDGGSVFACSSINHVVSSLLSGSAGGLIGNVLSGEITKCWADGTVSGYVVVGGLVGKNESGQIVECFSKGEITQSTYNIGGLVGYNQGLILNCYSYCNCQSGYRYIGGLTGGNTGEINQCYSTGIVNGNSSVGGLVPSNSGIITNCFWDMNTSGASWSAGGSGLDTYQMQDPNTFITAGWDFIVEEDNGTENIWRLCKEGMQYPDLSWKYAPSDFTCPDGTNNIDLYYFTNQWLLEGTGLTCDISPTPSGDGVVNFFDYTEFAKYWLEGVE